MTGWHHARVFMAAVAVLLEGYTGTCAQGLNKRTDTFEQRYPPDRVPTPPVTDKPPSPPPTPDAPSRIRAKPNKLPPLDRFAGAGRPTSRVVVPPRSFLDAGTEVLPGDRKFLDYALPPLHTPTDVLTNTGGRVGWHRSPLPGPLFPGRGPW
jgi:hypothetical protein